MFSFIGVAMVIVSFHSDRNPKTVTQFFFNYNMKLADTHA